MARLIAIAAVIAGSAVGCGSCNGGDRGTETPSGEGETSQDVAVVEGVVKLAEGAELPSYAPEEPNPAQPAPPSTCPPPREADRRPVTMGAARGLDHVLVAGAEFDTAPAHTPETHRVVIRDCRLSPMFVAATRGDTLEIINETDYPFMPIAGSAGVAQALMRGDSRTIQLDQGRVTSLGCTFTAPCGRTDVVTLLHGLHTVTADGGRFRLEVPAGEELEIHAWHPLFQEASTTLTVPAGETRHVELTLTPAASPGPAAPNEQPEETGDQAEPPEDNSDTLF